MTSKGVETLEQLVWYFSCLGFALLLVRLYAGKLAGTYKYLAVFAGAQLLQNLVLLWCYHMMRRQYGFVYTLSSAIVWITYILIVLELYNLAWQRYEGIATFSRKLLKFLLIIAIVGALISLMPDTKAMDQEMLKWVRQLATVSLVERGIVGSLVIFLVMIAGLLMWFPVQITRNAATHTILCCVFFLGIDASLFVRDISGLTRQNTRLASTVMLGVATICLFLWSILLKEQHESLQVVTGPGFRSPQGVDQASQQLEAINAALMRVTRK
jgi:hypothetical protein